jgi:hypothetical protein
MILAHGVCIYFGQVLKKITHVLGSLFRCMVQALNYFRQKVGCAIPMNFWRFFSQTHLVTLIDFESHSQK